MKIDTKKASGAIAPLASKLKQNLFGYYFGCLRPFLSHALLELDCLAFCKSLKAVPLNFRKMDKTIFPITRLNKPITLTIVKPFYFSLCHNSSSSNSFSGKANQAIQLTFPVFTGSPSRQDFAELNQNKPSTRYEP